MNTPLSDNYLENSDFHERSWCITPECQLFLETGFFMRTVADRFLLGPPTAAKREMIGIGQKGVRVLIVDQGDFPLAIEWSIFIHGDFPFQIRIYSR